VCYLASHLFAICCSALKCVAGICSVLLDTTLLCDLLQYVAECCSSLYSIIMCCDLLQCGNWCQNCVVSKTGSDLLQGAAECSKCYSGLYCVTWYHIGLQFVAACCSALQCVSVCHSVLQCVIWDQIGV